MKLKNLDNPWLIPTLFIAIPAYGLVTGAALGPLLIGPSSIDGVDIYAIGNLDRSAIGGAVGIALGLAIAAITIFLLIRQADAEAREEAEADGAAAARH